MISMNLLVSIYIVEEKQHKRQKKMLSYVFGKREYVFEFLKNLGKIKNGENLKT